MYVGLVALGLGAFGSIAAFTRTVYAVPFQIESHDQQIKRLQIEQANLAARLDAQHDLLIEMRNDLKYIKAKP